MFNKDINSNEPNRLEAIFLVIWNHEIFDWKKLPAFLWKSVYLLNQKYNLAKQNCYLIPTKCKRNRIFWKDVSYLSQLGITCCLKVQARVSLMTIENITKHHPYPSIHFQDQWVVWIDGDPMARNRIDFIYSEQRNWSFCRKSFARADAAFKFNWKVLKRN